MRINLRGKQIFQGLYAVLVSPTPIKVLAVFANHDKLREEFRTAVNQVTMWGTGFKVRLADQIIETPVGSQLFFRSVETGSHLDRLKGMEIHDLWVDNDLEPNSGLINFLRCRTRL